MEVILHHVGSEALECEDKKPGLESGTCVLVPSLTPTSQEAWPCKTLRTSVSPFHKTEINNVTGPI